MERWVMSPVWIMKAGLFGRAPTLAIASSSVPNGFGLAGCLNPMWLSDIWRKLNPFAAWALAAEIPSSEEDRGIPPAIVHGTPVPAQIMHSSAPRRSMPSLSSCAICLSFGRFGPTGKRLAGAGVYSRAIREKLGRGTAMDHDDRDRL